MPNKNITTEEALKIHDLDTGVSPDELSIAITDEKIDLASHCLGGAVAIGFTIAAAYLTTLNVVALATEAVNRNVGNAADLGANLVFLFFTLLVDKKVIEVIKSDKAVLDRLLDFQYLMESDETTEY